MSRLSGQILRRLEALGWEDVLPETPQVSGDTRFLKDYFLPAHAAPRRGQYRAVLAALGGREALCHAVRGRLKRLLGEEKGAEREFARALRADPRCAAALAYRAELKLSSNPEEALEDLGRAVRVEPPRASYRLWEGYGRFLLGNLGGAEQSLGRALSLDRGLVAGLILRGMVRSRSGDWRGATRDYGAAIRAAPGCPGLFTLRAFSRFQGGDRRGAVEDAHRAITLHPENLDGFVRILFLFAGEAPPPDPEAQREMLTKAAEEAIAREPDCAWAHAALAEVIGRRGAGRDAERSARELETAARLEPRRAWVRAFLGRALTVFHQESRTREALRQADRAVRLAPRAGWMRCWRAEVLKEAGKHSAALKDLDAGLGLDPGYRLAFAWRADLRESLGDLSGALADWDSALEVLPREAFHRRRALVRRKLGRKQGTLERSGR